VIRPAFIPGIMAKINYPPLEKVTFVELPEEVKGVIK
jgi:hypothetical protein